MIKILIVSEDQSLAGELTELADKAGCSVSCQSEYRQVIAAMRAGHYDVYLVDKLVFGGEGLRLVRAGREQGSGAAYIVICPNDESEGQSILSSGATTFMRREELGSVFLYVLRFALASNSVWLSARKQEKYLRALSQSESVGMLLVGEDMNVKVANSFAWHLSGFRGEIKQEQPGTRLGEVVGCKHYNECKSKCGDATGHEVCQLAACVREAFNSGSSLSYREMEMVIANNDFDSKIWVRISIKPVYIDGQKYAVVTIDDLTVRHEMEQLLKKSEAQAQADQKRLVEVNEQLKQIVAQTNEMVQEAFATSNAKNNFMANVSHELRTPLNGIQGFCQLLLEEPLSESQRDYAQTILGCAKDLTKVLNNVLDFTRLEKNAISMVRTWFNIEDVIDDMAVLFKGVAQEKGLRFEINTEGQYPQEICSDQGKLKQVLINIVDNAIKYTSKGSVEIDVSSLEVSDSMFVCFDVKDTGIGMSPEVNTKIFESFSQADNSATRKYDGLGLGLTVAQRYMELLGGKIEVDSTEGEGSKFSVVVPVNRKVRHVRLSERAETVQEMRGVLIIESQRCQSEIISQYLTQMAVESDIVDDCEEALERLMNYNYNYVLLDTSMSELCDESVIEVLQEVTKLFPIVAMCQERDKRISELCKRIGIRDILFRPVEKAKLDALTIEYCKVSQEVVEANLDMDARDFFTNVVDCSMPEVVTGFVESSQVEVDPIYSSLIGDPEMQDVIDSFLAMLPDYMESLGQAINNESLPEVGAIAFDFRDSAGTAGYRDLRLLVLVLEKAVQSKDLDSVRKIYRDISMFIPGILKGKSEVGVSH